MPQFSLNNKTSTSGRLLKPFVLDLVPCRHSPFSFVFVYLALCLHHECNNQLAQPAIVPRERQTGLQYVQIYLTCAPVFTGLYSCANSPTSYTCCCTFVTTKLITTRTMLQSCTRLYNPPGFQHQKKMEESNHVNDLPSSNKSTAGKHTRGVGSPWPHSGQENFLLLFSTCFHNTSFSFS